MVLSAAAFTVVSWAFGGAFVLCIAAMLGVALWSKLGPTVRVPAVVVRRRTVTRDLERNMNWGASENVAIDAAIDFIAENRTEGAAICDFYLVFRTPDGRDQEFRVPESVYIELEKGDRGLLTYRGETFRGFVRDSFGSGRA